MSAINDGGPAFPKFGMNAWDKPQTISAGMSLRDWFAGQALAGIIAFPGTIEGDANKRNDVLSRLSYALADAMLAERAKAVSP